ncbi:glycosyltransferase family 2 protein [Cellulomonas cellasea]|uniref:glycosyltransferase family 2 protein n=1 Tax=Cellulomonas cellasea TaxID=43670 RepID=UPI0025A35293|nr:glycosyltransferase family 2 protein [Cellulomonas cellasea]MDM8083230.1 glycosyltransferase family 2 protein [Cellulomonas cellasea]
MISTPEVVVVVVTHNSALDLDPLLDSLPAALGSVVAEVVVVDNGSTDGTADLARARADCLVVSQANRGYAAGINAGADAVPGAGLVLVLNPDARLAPHAVELMVEALKRTGAGIVAPRVVDEQGRLAWSLRRAPTLGRATGLGFTGWAAVSEHITDPRAYVVEHPVDWALGAVLLVDRTCHDALGGWDESFFLYSEETDLCLRAADAGWRTVYTPHAEVMHAGGGSGRTPRTHAMQIVNRVRLYARRHRRPASAVYYALVVASELSWLARGHQESRASLAALLRPGRRPAELGCPPALVPR